MGEVFSSLAARGEGEGDGREAVAASNGHAPLP